MATIQKFEDIEAWQKARELTRQFLWCRMTVCVGRRDFAATNFLSLPKTALS
jgi:hypothetical protein